MKIIRIDGVIGDWNNTIEEIQWRIEALGLESGDDLKVIINSIGGSVFEGFAIYNYLVASDYVIHTEIQGICASIATLIAMAGDTKNSSISEVAMFMIHKASIGLIGNAEELEKQAEILASIDETLITVYTSRSGLTRNEVDKLLSEETWYTAKDTVKAGFIGNVINKIDAKMVALASQNLKQTNMKIIEDLLKKYRGETIVTPTKEEIEAKAEKDRFEALTPEEQTAELEAKEKERFDALTPEEQQAELDAKETPDNKFATIEQFEKLEALVTDSLSQQSAGIEEVIKNSIQDAIKGLPRSKGTPNQPQSKVNVPVNGYVDVNQKFREKQAEIEARTRLK